MHCNAKRQDIWPCWGGQRSELALDRWLWYETPGEESPAKERSGTMCSSLSISSQQLAAPQVLVLGKDAADLHGFSPKL